MTSGRETVTALLEDLISSAVLTTPDALAARFTEDATYVVGPGFELVEGRAAIVAELVRQTSTFSDLTIEVSAWIADQHRIVTERVDGFTLRHNGVRAVNPVVAVFDIDDAGLISGWREYWDAASLGKLIAAPAAG